MKLLFQIALSPNFYIILGIVILIFFLELRKHIYSILDPINYLILSESIVTSAMIWLFIEDEVKTIWFLYFILCQLGLIYGLKRYKPLRNEDIFRKNTEYKDLYRGNIVKFILVISGLLFLIFQYYSYRIIGFGIQAEENGTTRLGVWHEGNGLGLIIRLIQGLRTILLVSIFEVITRKQKKKNILFKVIAIFFLIDVFFDLAVSGSKFGFLGILFIYFLYRFYVNSLNNKWNFKKIIIYLLGIIFSMFTMVLIVKKTHDTTFARSFSLIGFRLIAESDGIVQTFSKEYNAISFIEYKNPFLTLISPFLTPLRILPRSLVDTAVGFQISGQSDRGPNGRHNIVGYLIFSWGGIAFSYLIGVVISFVRTKMYKLLSNDFTGALIYIILVHNLIALNIDPIMAEGFLFNDLLVFGILYGTTMFFVKSDSLRKARIRLQSNHTL